MTEKEYLEFKNTIAMGDELNFYYKNDEYWISHNPGKSYLSRTRDSYTQEFNGYEELFKKATIDSIKISDIYPSLKW
ncbi:hypothetical protein [Lysinibacillus parviboronicapiens]|uniref:hypothetical protein n=1 Tax=Lysinibacillus parviboronicapiens TaxID=436516 RepID=UPI000D378C05|nr:hypothetical protein [Lysinibacillus parviboronicapiens]